MDTVLFWVFTAIYIAITLFLAYLAWKKTKSGDQFLVAGREVSPWIIGLSYGATFISTSAIVGFGGVAAQLGMGVIWLTVLNIGVGILVAFIVFGKPTRRLGHKLNALTFPDLLGKRFQSPFMQYSTSILILVSMPLYSSAVIIGGASFINVVLGVPYEWALIGFAVITALYVVFGGLLGVMYTDAFQGILMMIGMTAVLILTYSMLGGVTTAHTALTNMSGLVPAGLASAGNDRMDLHAGLRLDHMAEDDHHHRHGRRDRRTGTATVDRPFHDRQGLEGTEPGRSDRGRVHHHDDRGRLHRRCVDQRLLLSTNTERSPRPRRRWQATPTRSFRCSSTPRCRTSSSCCSC